MLKRVVFFVAMAAFLVALTSFNIASAGPQAKVKVCHHNPDMDDDPPLEWFVIEVAEPAVAAHMAHGDCLAAEDAVVGEPCSCVAE